MELNGYVLEGDCRNNELRQPQSMDGNGIDTIPLEAGMRRKNQEFIDHSLLAPDFIRDQNNFMIDLIDHPPVFTKNGIPTTTDTNIEGYTAKDGLPTELQFSHSLFSYVNRHPNELDESTENISRLPGASTVIPAFSAHSMPISVPSVGHSNVPFSPKHTTDFMGLNGDFLTPTSERTSVRPADVQQFSTLSLLPDVGFDEVEYVLPDTDMSHFQGNPRKVLPHKKRISKKLKVPQQLVASDSVYSDGLEQSTQQDLPGLAGSLSRFNCEICGRCSASQIEFFAHLKEHYEPSVNVPHPILATMKTSLEDLQSDVNCDAMCSITKKADNNTNVDQVFNDVPLNFDDFQNVDESVCGVNMKMLNSNIIENYADGPPLKDISTDEVEFSDTEDMLEGIRNVVDKVSIEDTCDDADLIGVSSMRGPWFANNIFNEIPFKSKNCDEESLSGSLARILEAESQGASVSTGTELNQSPKRTLYENSPIANEIVDGVQEQEGNKEPNSSQSSADSSSAISKPCPKSKKTQKRKTSKVKSKKPERRKSDESLDIVEGRDGEPVSSSEEAKSARKRSTKHYICPQCQREFNSLNALKYHSITHTGRRQYGCEECGRAFFALNALKSHLRTHTGDKPYICDHCHRCFRQCSDLKYHIVSLHTEEKSYQCEFCGKAFSRKYSLVLHRRIHTSEKNYVCEYCNKAFRASVYLQDHRKIHTGEKPHECSMCGKRFRLSGDLRRHVRSHQRKSMKDQKPELDETSLSDD